MPSTCGIGFKDRLERPSAQGQSKATAKSGQFDALPVKVGCKHRVACLRFRVKPQRVLCEHRQVGAITHGYPAKLVRDASGDRRRNGHCPIGFCRVDSLVRLRQCAARLVDRPPQLGISERSTRIANPDRPVRAEHDIRTVVKQIANAPAMSYPFWADTP